MVYPINQRVGWKRKETGEYFRLGMPPTPNTKPPIGEDSQLPPLKGMAYNQTLKGPNLYRKNDFSQSSQSTEFYFFL
jgi:hypothetical protein